MLTNILGSIAALFLAAAAYLGYKNWDAYKLQIAERQTEERILAQKQAKLKETQEEVKVAEADLEQAESTLASAKEDLEEQNNLIADVEGQIEDKKLAVTERQEDLNLAKESTDKVGDVDELIADVKKYQEEIAELEAEISSTKSKRDSLDSQSESLVQHIGKVRERIGLYAKQQSDPNLKTAVSSVYGGFGFVTLKGGDNVGVIKGSKLNVVRGDEVIAQLIVTAVEASRSAANIIPDTLAADTSVYPGDTVVASVPQETTIAN